MNRILLSVAIFGFLHPTSKVLLSTGIPLSYFCILYIGIRLLIQIVYIGSTKKKLSRLKNNIPKLITLGLIGALLQFFEFKGIEEGLPPGIVTLLMFSYPIWTTLFDITKKNKPKALLSFTPPFFALLGIFLISDITFPLQSSINGSIIYPILAGLFVAIWITYSNILAKNGIDTLSLSLFYDLFSFLALLLFLGNDLVNDYSLFVEWINFTNIGYISAFSILIGLLPNVLFYDGIKKIKSHNAGMIMATEPIFSIFYSSFIWRSSFDVNFILGTLSIILANIPGLFSSKESSEGQVLSDRRV
ncbi:DMT family transporter [Bacteriovoracaceae bacterium]|nr:DMT family transporter [Bacteriovoracaceae bacterium]